MKQKLNEEIGERIRAKRLACKLTQDKLSELVGISGKHLSEVERGNDRLSYEKLLLLCDALDCSTDYLLRGRNTLADGVEIPETILEVFRRSDQKEIALLQESLQLYSKMFDHSK